MKIKDKQALRRKIANRNDKEMEKFKTDIAMRTINELQVITAYVLQSEFGFGIVFGSVKKRVACELDVVQNVFCSDLFLIIPVYNNRFTAFVIAQKAE